jgi:hypothetical protein
MAMHNHQDLPVPIVLNGADYQGEILEAVVGKSGIVALGSRAHDHVGFELKPHATSEQKYCLFVILTQQEAHDLSEALRGMLRRIRGPSNG